MIGTLSAAKVVPCDRPRARQPSPARLRASIVRRLMGSVVSVSCMVKSPLPSIGVHYTGKCRPGAGPSLGTYVGAAFIHFPHITGTQPPPPVHCTLLIALRSCQEHPDVNR